MVLQPLRHPVHGFPVWSPFALLYFAAPSPITLAWIQLAKAVVAGLGAFLFFRLALGARFWPAGAGAWVFPFCGYLVFWQGQFLSDSAVWLPWVLLATDRAVRRPGGWGGPGLSLAVALSLLSGTDRLARNPCSPRACTPFISRFESRA